MPNFITLIPIKNTIKIFDRFKWKSITMIIIVIIEIKLFYTYLWKEKS